MDRFINYRSALINTNELGEFKLLLELGLINKNDMMPHILYLLTPWEICPIYQKKINSSI